MIDLDPNSPEARRAAEMARELATARMAGADVANATLTKVVNELSQSPPALLGHTLAALAALVTTVTETYAHALTEAGQPITREELWAVLAQQLTAAGITI